MVGETLEQATRMGAPRAVALCQNFGGYLDFQSGAWDEAEQSLCYAVETYRVFGAASGESLSLQRLGVLLTAKGRLAEDWRFWTKALSWPSARSCAPTP